MLISYNVKISQRKLSNKIKKDKNYINKELVNIIFKRRERVCYEKSRVS